VIFGIACLPWQATIGERPLQEARRLRLSVPGVETDRRRREFRPVDANKSWARQYFGVGEILDRFHELLEWRQRHEQGPASTNETPTQYA